jgi:hypothetical protein
VEAQHGCKWCAPTVRLCANAIISIIVLRAHLYDALVYTKEVCFNCVNHVPLHSETLHFAHTKYLFFHVILWINSDYFPTHT